MEEEDGKEVKEKQCVEERRSAASVAGIRVEETEHPAESELL